MLEQAFLLRPAAFLCQHLRGFEIELGIMNPPADVVRELVDEFFEVGGGHVWLFNIM